MGDEPSHPELLDWLATELVARGWSLKAMHRLIVTSATYRQSSRPRSPAECEADPENRWLSAPESPPARRRGDPRRPARGLGPAEPGPGRARRLPAPAPRADEALEQGGDLARFGPGRGPNRRSLYVFVRRNLRYPFFEAFDRPDTNASCPQAARHHDRAAGTEPAQQPALVRSGPALAARAEREAGWSIDARVERAYLLTLGRRPDETERALARDFLSTAGSSFADFCLALINLNEFVYVD